MGPREAASQAAPAIHILRKVTEMKEPVMVMVNQLLAINTISAWSVQRSVEVTECERMAGEDVEPLHGRRR